MSKIECRGKCICPKCGEDLSDEISEVLSMSFNEELDNGGIYTIVVSCPECWSGYSVRCNVKRIATIENIEKFKGGD